MSKIMRRMRTINRCQNLFRSAHLHADLRAAHHMFVFRICHSPGSSQEQLAKDLYLEKSTVARALNTLEESGYISRTPNPEDKRQSLVFPTEKMHAILPEVHAVADEWNCLITRDISEEELAVFTSVLARIEKSATDAVTQRGDEER